MRGAGPPPAAPFGTGLGVGAAGDACRIAAVEGQGDERMFEDVPGDAPVWDALVVGRKGAAGETGASLGRGQEGKWHVGAQGLLGGGGRHGAPGPSWQRLFAVGYAAGVAWRVQMVMPWK